MAYPKSEEDWETPEEEIIWRCRLALLRATWKRRFHNGVGCEKVQYPPRDWMLVDLQVKDREYREVLQ